MGTSLVNVIQSRLKSSYPQIFFNSCLSCKFSETLKDLLDVKLNFNHHIKEKMTKAMKGTGVIKRLSTIFPQYPLPTIYKSSVRLHFNYRNVLYDQQNNKKVYVKN